MPPHAPRSPARFVLSASAALDAPPGPVYRILADYRHGHPAILPRPPFVSLEVEEGGFGEGTLIRVTMKVLGREQRFRARVTEPEPGRMLVETNDTGFTTAFTVDPLEGGARSRVTITTVREDGDGLLRAVEARLVSAILRPVYRRELTLLAQRAEETLEGGEGPP